MFKYRELIHEELRNLRAHYLSSLLLAVVSLLLAVLTLNIGYADVKRILDTNSRYVEVGITTFEARRSSNQTLDAARCEELRELPFVRASGAASRSGTANVLLLPGQPVPLMRGTAGVAHVIWPADETTSLDRSSVIVGSSIADELGLGFGSYLSIEQASRFLAVPVDHVALDSARTRSANSMVFVRTPLVDAESCFVEFDRAASDAASELLFGWWDPVTDVIVSRIYVDDSGNFEPISAALDNRVGSKPVGGGIVALGVAASVYFYARRGSYAIYRQFGLDWRGSLTVAITAGVILMALPYCMGIGAWLVLNRLQHTGHEALGWAVRDSCIFALGPMLATMLVATLIRTLSAHSVYSGR